MEKEFVIFSHDLQQQIISNTDMDNQESSRESFFTQYMIECLIEDGTLSDGVVHYYRGHGVKLNGYEMSDDSDRLDLFITRYIGVAPPQSVYRSEVKTEIKRANNFFRKCINRNSLFTSEMSEISDLVNRIHSVKDELTIVNVFYFTDGIVKKERFEDETVDGIRISYHVWDIERLYRSLSSGEVRESIEIDLTTFGKPVYCLPMIDKNSVYHTYLAILPGEILAKIYDEYGPRLLERNVRSFLQARGNVNKSIRDTIKNEPHMFLAYNNGISAVAKEVTTIELSDGRIGISIIKDLQIVNGGQSTASIHNALKKDKIRLEGLNLQFKLTVILDIENIDNIVPKISEYANNQNKIQNADFSANDPFHRMIEQLSRTIWAPSQKGMQEQTRWYYERARGQYMVDRGKDHTLSYKKRFDALHPKSQKFTKTDLAKYENTWNMLPYIVSRGAQKNFNDFTLRIYENGSFELDKVYFEKLIAKAIIFRKAEKIVQAQKYGGYRANIVTYTLSWIGYNFPTINLLDVWKEQDISSEFEQTIILVSRITYEHITAVPAGGNVTEWCKKKDCWDTFKKLSINIPDHITIEFKK